jgi:PAS domain S-box-containing protein
MMQVTESLQSRENILAMNEALMLGSLRQHELAEASELLNVQLQREISERKLVEERLAKTVAELASIQSAISEAAIIAITDVTGKIEQVNDNFVRISKYSREELIGQDHRIVNSGLHPKEFIRDLWVTIANGKVWRNQIQNRAKDGSLYWVDTTIAPIRNEHGKVVKYMAVRFDITERKRVEAVLHESQERFHTLFELGPVAVYYCDASGVIQNYNRRASELWGREPTLGDTNERFCGSFKLFRPDGSFVPHEQCPMAEVIFGKIPEASGTEVLIERHDGSQVSVVVKIRPLKNERGEITGAINCFYDITERKEAEQRQHFLMTELAHRSKNLLAVISSIASQSLSGTRSLPEARKVLTQRIQALARSQTALVAGGFEGASIAEIISLEFEGFSDQVKSVGPNVLLKPRVAQTFALVVHELATNATKYGALSLPDGQVAVHWLVEGTGAEARFKFQWQERNGPPVTPPTRRGFGHMVIEKAAAQDFGSPKIRFESEGLSYEIDALLSAVAATEGSSLRETQVHEN